jgi:CDP-glucose 4,6-dehydratase
LNEDLTTELRNRILSLTREYGEIFTMKKEFNPGVDPVPVSGVVLDAQDFVALVDSSLDGWFTSDRLIPDIIKNLKVGQAAQIRHPEYVRPWQHVLDCLNGYLFVIEHLLKSGESVCWNIGPLESNYRIVDDLAMEVLKEWPSTSSWIQDTADYKKESELLTLDSSKVRNTTGWHDKYDFEESVKQTASWYRRITNGESSLLVSQE